MKKSSKTKWEDINKPNCEKKKYTSSNTYSEHGKSYFYVRCPFCSEQTRAYIWSISGGGKRCNNLNCGALFGSDGDSYKLKGSEV